MVSEISQGISLSFMNGWSGNTVNLQRDGSNQSENPVLFKMKWNEKMYI